MDNDFERLVDPKKYFPDNLSKGNLLNNLGFISALESHLKLLSRSQYWPKEKIEDLQLKRLKLLYGQILKKSKFWTKTFSEKKVTFKNLSELRELPVLNRKKLRQLGDSIYLQPDIEDGSIFSRTSSGTTGLPLKIRYFEREMFISYLILFFRHPLFENTDFKSILSKKNFIVLGKPGFRYVFEDDFFLESFADLSSADLDDFECRKKIYGALQKAEYPILAGFGSLIAKLAKSAQEDKFDLKLFAVRPSSEPVSADDKKLISERFKSPIVNFLSGNGTGVIGFECDMNPGKFHANSESIILEAVDEKGKLLPFGELGELVATSLDFTLMPIMRFALNDNGRILDEKCPCGKNLTLFEFVGRRGYEVILPSGRKIRMIELHKVVMDWWRFNKKPREIQIVQNRIDSLLILLNSKKLPEFEEINLRMAISSLFDFEKMNFEIRYVDATFPGRSHKPVFFIPYSDFQERFKKD